MYLGKHGVLVERFLEFPVAAGEVDEHDGHGDVKQRREDRQRNDDVIVVVADVCDDVIQHVTARVQVQQGGGRV